MQFLELIWNIYLDGYTFDHWFSIVWMVAINTTFVLHPYLWWVQRKDMKDLHKRVHLRNRMMSH